MGIEVAQPLRLRGGAGRSVPRHQFAKARPGASMNALLGMGLWSLLWLGYNTGPGYVMTPGFPHNALEFIHGIRAFFPMLASFIAFLLIVARSKRLFERLMSPLGLMLAYAILGIASSLTLSPDPVNALYYGANYLAIVLALLAIVLVEDPLPTLWKVLKFTWIVGTILTLSLLGAIPFLGSAAVIASESSPVGVRAYGSAPDLLGMTGTRNTGFARYAAISALVALPGVLRKGKLVVRIIWGIVLAASLYALIIANGRTETLAFVGGVVVILVAEKAKRTVNILVSVGATILLGLRGFFSGFYLYITRTGHFDTTMSGRTATWDEAWHYIFQSPWVGYGFQADRYFLQQHMHNAFLHVLIQSGLLGGGAILIGFVIVWVNIIRYFFIRQPADKSLIPPEIPAVFLFVTISSLTESTFAYFSAAWLLSAPIVGYVEVLGRQQRRISAMAAQERFQRMRLARRNSRVLRSPLGVTPSTAGGGNAD